MKLAERCNCEIAMSTPSSCSYTIEQYQPVHKPEWDAFVRSSKNATFLFTRDYMDYHSDRFDDYSLIIRLGSDVAALLPANRNHHELHSHQGLTYGGLLLSALMTTPSLLILFDSLLSHLRSVGFRHFYYKTIPSIYHQLPSEEDRYALFLAGAILSRRDVLSVVAMRRRGPVQNRRKRGAAKALRRGVVIAQSQDWCRFWTLLAKTLEDRFAVRPVHSIGEIQLLHSRFPEQIRLFEARCGDDVLAGAVIFESAMVAHVQYIASSIRGREVGALDLLFNHLIESVFQEKMFFDFGISNEHEGKLLNRGLIEQKEGFGARAVVHDFYTLDL